MRLALTLIIVALASIALIYFLASKKIISTYRAVDCYVCTRCAIHKHVTRQRLGPITYRTETEFYKGDISRVLMGGEFGTHDWLLYLSRPNLNRPFAPNTPGGDRVNFSIERLDYVPGLASEFARMPNPRNTFTSLVTALGTNAAFEKAFLEQWLWIPTRRTNDSFSAWAATNGYWSPFTNKPANLRR